MEFQKILIRECGEKEDFDTLKQEMHKIKGGASNVFATFLYDVSVKIELAAKDSDGNCVQELLLQFEVEVVRFFEFLKGL